MRLSSPIPAPTDFDAVRADFPRASTAAYLDNASCHPLSVHVAAALHRYIDCASCDVGDPWWPAWAQARDESKRLFAALINAQPQEIAFARSAVEAESNLLNGMGEYLAGGNITTNDLHYNAALYNYKMRQMDGLEGRVAGGVFTRVAASHIRVGTFQYFHARNDIDALRLLADPVIRRHYPYAAEAADPYVTLLESVMIAQADLIAQWMSLGFIHGVMNTDNTTISGETIDYGPCAFMDTFHPQCVFSSIDRGARYAWGNQPEIGLWNLTRFAETLLQYCAVLSRGLWPI